MSYESPSGKPVTKISIGRCPVTGIEYINSCLGRTPYTSGPLILGLLLTLGVNI